MKTVFGDFETYYDDLYSLRRMTPVEYILDPRFEMIAVAIAEGDDPPTFKEHDPFVEYLSTLDPNDTCFVSHNALFDACLLAWRYHFIPALYIDTMSMARATIYHKTGHVSLDAVQKYFGFGEKLKTIANVKGMNKQAIKDNDLWLDYAVYGIDDCTKMRMIFNAMRPSFPMSEFLVMDSVIRCAVNPVFKLDTGILHSHLHEVKTNKETLLARTGLQSRDSLMSDEAFARALQSLGVDPPRKITAKGNDKWAFAKTDEAFTDLEEHPDTNVQALVAARLGIKTTLEETRTQRMISISQLIWPRKGDGPAADKMLPFMDAWMPIPLRYSGAHTHRLSGDWKLNAQNWSKVKPDGSGGNIRKSLVAPQGHSVVAADASQIEARLTAWFCGQEDLRKAFEDGEDIYSQFAQEEIYHYPVTNSKETKLERFIGKQAILGAGFGAGGPKFQWMVETLSRVILGQQIEYDEVRAKTVINAYRRRYSNISGMWPTLLQTCSAIARGDTGVLGTDGVVSYGQDFIRLPNGLSLFYDGLRCEASPRGTQWTFTFAKKKKFLHGGKILENIIQALARIVVMDAAVRMRQKYGLHYALQVHDELVYVVPTEKATWVLASLITEMTTRPWWGPTIPLAAEGAIGHSYGDVK